MSKNKRKMTRKRFVKLIAASFGFQVPETRDLVMRRRVYLKKRDQEQYNMEKHQRKKTGAEVKNHGKH